IAVAEDLIRRRITSPRHLGIIGHSNGGGLVGVALNWRPDLFHAAVAENPVLDFAIDRFEHVRGEFGALADPAEREFLGQSSPLANLRKSDDFPVPFITTSTSDVRVPSIMARRYVSRLSELGMDYLYYEPRDGGHGFGVTPEQIATHEALVYIYLAER